MIENAFVLPCGLTLPNRIVKAAMTERLAGVDGRATRAHARLFERFAHGGAGMLITGNVAVDSAHLEAPGNVWIDRENSLDALSAWARAGRSAQGAMIMQINHAGRQTPRSVSAHSLAPSAIPLKFGRYFSTPRAMTEDEIEATAEQFVYAAAIAAKAGFDGVQVHAAHGYLLSQFLSPRVNCRDDQWGGALENRARLLLDIVRAIRASAAARFAVGVKLNVGDFIKGGLEPEDAAQTAAWLGLSGVDFIELSGGTHERAVSFGFGDEAESPKEVYFRQQAKTIRKATNVPLILTGGMRHRSTMTTVIREDVCDLIGMARPLAIEPDLPRRLVRNETQAARSVRLKLPRPPRDGLAELAWRREQLARMARGKEPKLTISPKLAVIRMLMQEQSFAAKRARAQRLAARSS